MSTTTRPEREIDPSTAVLGVLTLIAFATAAALRFVVDVLAPPGSVSYRTSADPDAVPDVLSTIGAAAVGIGILLFAATLVVAVMRHRVGRLPVVIGACTLLVTVVAIAAGVLPAHVEDVDAEFRLDTLRTALIALAGACLPAVVVGAIRTRGRR